MQLLYLNKIVILCLPAEYCHSRSRKYTRAANIPSPNVLFIVAAPYSCQEKHYIFIHGMNIETVYLRKSKRGVGFCFLCSKHER